MRCRLGHDKISERRVCRALSQPRSTQRYKAKKPDADRQLIAEMRRLVEALPRYGSERVHQLLIGTNWKVNFKRVHRLWKQEHMQVPKNRQNAGVCRVYRPTDALDTEPCVVTMCGAMTS